jgi:hypothetical protein
MSLLLKRNDWSVQFPALRAAERDEEAIAPWRDEQWPIIKVFLALCPRRLACAKMGRAGAVRVEADLSLAIKAV